MVNCVILSECVYKVVDMGPLPAAAIACQLSQDFPPPLFTLRRLQWSEPHVRHRCAQVWQPHYAAPSGARHELGFAMRRGQRGAVTGGDEYSLLERHFIGQVCVE
jgi:hypothetical protein